MGRRQPNVRFDPGERFFDSQKNVGGVVEWVGFGKIGLHYDKPVLLFLKLDKVRPRVRDKRCLRLRKDGTPPAFIMKMERG